MEFGDDDFDDLYLNLNNIQLYNEIIPPNEHNIGGLYLGKIELTYKTQQLQDLKIGAILSIIGYKFHFEASKNVKHLFIQAEDDMWENISDYFKLSYDFLHENLKKTNVYVHCQMGISRSSSIVISYLMKERNISYKQALEYVRSKRNCVCPNEGFQEQLIEYQNHLNGSQNQSNNNNQDSVQQNNNDQVQQNN